MAADHHRPGLFNLVVTAAQDGFHNFERLTGGGKTDDIKRRKRFSTHGIDITQGIGSSNLPEQVGIVNDGRKKINSLYQSMRFRYPVNTGIRKMLLPVQIIGIIKLRQRAQHLRQGLRPDFCCSPGAGCHFCQAHLFPLHLLNLPGKSD